MGARGTGHTAGEASEPAAADAGAAVGVATAEVVLAALGAHDAATSTKDIAHVQASVRLNDAECGWSCVVTICMAYANLRRRNAVSCENFQNSIRHK